MEHKENQRKMFSWVNNGPYKWGYGNVNGTKKEIELCEWMNA